MQDGMVMMEYKMIEKSRISQDKKGACVTFNSDVSCKKVVQALLGMPV
jgi:hypothetical protein